MNADGAEPSMALRTSISMASKSCLACCWSCADSSLSSLPPTCRASARSSPTKSVMCAPHLGWGLKDPEKRDERRTTTGAMSRSPLQVLTGEPCPDEGLTCPGYPRGISHQGQYSLKKHPFFSSCVAHFVLLPATEGSVHSIQARKSHRVST